MPAMVALTLPVFPLPALLVGAVFGYLLVMFTNPVRNSLRDGLRCIRRYSALWLTLGAFGFAYALFQLALRVYFHKVLPPGEGPVFVWAREAWRDPRFWLSGSPESLWYLPPHSLWRVAVESILPALESVAGIFNLLVPTFPLSVVAAVLFLMNWEGHHAVLWRALLKRFGARGWAIYGGILICALAAVAKPLLYVVPHLFGDYAKAATLWFLWAPVIEWLGFLFEYLVGVCVQICLILTAYCWVRGLTFTNQHLLDFAIRRFSLVVRWALIVMLLSSLLIHLPLILKNFPLFQSWFPQEEAALDFRWKIARGLLAVALLVFATMQITLIFHSESLGRAVRDHWRFVRCHWWSFGWLLMVAAMHFHLLRVVLELIQRGLGEGTALGVTWSLCAPWLNGLMSAWLLASWVCFYKYSDRDRAPSREETALEQGVLF